MDETRRRLQSLHVGISWSTQGAGGSGRVFADLAKFLPAAGVDFRGAVAAPAGVEQATGGLVRNFAEPGTGSLGRLLGARRIISAMLESNRPEILATHFALFTAPVLDRLKRQAHVVHFHGPWFAESVEEGAGETVARAKRLIETQVYSRATRMIVLSQAFARLAVETYGVPESKIRVVPGTVDVERFAIPQNRRQAREELGLPQDRKILVAVRRLVNRMGLQNLIRAMQAIVRAHPEALLLIAGKGRMQAALQQLITELGLEGSVRLLGFVPDAELPLLYRAADLNVVPTLALEGFGLIAAEALAAGTPSIVTPVGGLPEVVAPLSERLVLSSAELPDLKQGLMDALSDPASLPSETECRSYAAKNFHARLMAERTAAVYRQALARG